MADRFYRLRSIDSLLGVHEELQRQEIYFASPNELNDPMDGFKDIFWHGDEIVWTNLLRHYLRSLQSAVLLSCLTGEKDPVDWESISVVDLGATEYRSEAERLTHEKMCARFFIEPIRTWIHHLGTRDRPVRRDEFITYLKWLHGFALDTVFDVLEQEGFRVRISGAKDIAFNHEEHIANLTRLSNLLTQVAIEKDGTPDAISALFQAWRHTDLQVHLLSAHAGELQPHLKNKYFICVKFPESYANRLEKLVYPDWYTACFAGDCTNASLWGYYGGNHEGVCLIFRAEQVDGRAMLPLIHADSSFSPSSGVGTRSVIREFVKVDYEPTYPPIDFFRSLGRMSVVTLNREWYGDRQGNRSKCADDIFSDEEAWRRGYWKQFQRSCATKMKDWEHENEFRLVLDGFFSDLSERASRKAKYEFSSLEGIVFGIKTSLDDKLKIMKIIEEKCKTENRTDFKFYQATYSPGDGKITRDEMGLFNSSPSLNRPTSSGFGRTHD